jgi:hypothetical protein
MRNDEPLLRAGLLVEELDKVHGLGNRMAVQLLRLKIILQGQPVDLKRIGDTMARLLRAAVLTDRTFRLFVHACYDQG